MTRTTKQLDDLMGEKKWEIRGYVARGKTLYDALTDDVGPHNESLYSLRASESFDYDAEFEYWREEFPDKTGDEIWYMVHESLNDQLWMLHSDIVTAHKNKGSEEVLEAACMTWDQIEITEVSCNRADCGGMIPVDLSDEDDYFCPECEAFYCGGHSPAEVGEECWGCEHVFTAIEAFAESVGKKVA